MRRKDAICIILRYKSRIEPPSHITRRLSAFSYLQKKSKERDSGSRKDTIRLLSFHAADFLVLPLIESHSAMGYVWISVEYRAARCKLRFQVQSQLSDYSLVLVVPSAFISDRDDSPSHPPLLSFFYSQYSVIFYQHFL